VTLCPSSIPHVTSSEWTRSFEVRDHLLTCWAIYSHVMLLRSHFLYFLNSFYNEYLRQNNVTCWPSGYLQGALVSRFIFGIWHTRTWRTYGCVIWQVYPQGEESKWNCELSSNRLRCSTANTREFRYLLRGMKDSERRYCACSMSMLKCVCEREREREREV